MQLDEKLPLSRKQNIIMSKSYGKSKRPYPSNLLFRRRMKKAKGLSVPNKDDLHQGQNTLN